MNNWKTVWNKRSRVNNSVLEALVKADGFDSGAGLFSVEAWLEYANSLFSKLGIKEGDSIYEVGCGSGAFIYPLYIKGHSVSGLDYSSVLIDLANTVMSDANFENLEASDINPSKKYDFIISHSAFHYFPSHKYAKEVIIKMIEKSNKKIALFDINDKQKEDIYHKVRMEGLSQDQYIEKYKGLDHLFYEKRWFQNIAETLNLKLSIFDQSFKKYENSTLRFNVIMEKN